MCVGFPPSGGRGCAKTITFYMSNLTFITPSTAMPLWNNFISSIPSITPFSFNPSLYNFYKKHYSWKPYYIMLTSKDEVCAIFPIVNTGKAWVSLPHFSYGGILYQEKCMETTESDITNTIITQITSSKLTPGFYNYNFPLSTESGGGFPLRRGSGGGSFIRTLTKTPNSNYTKTEKVTSLLILPSNKSDLLTILSQNIKRKINKAKKSQIIIKSGGLELLNDFYIVYSRNIYKLNSLNYGKDFIKDLFSTYEFGNIVIFVAYINNKPIGSSLLASYNGFYENMFFATSKESRKYYVSDLLHWEMISYSIKNNSLSNNKTNGVYSFGRSTINSGIHKYKSHWPITDHPIYHYSNIPDIKSQGWLQSVWSKIPYFISSPLGAKLIKHIY